MKKNECIRIGFVADEYYSQHKEYVEILDRNDHEKRKKRMFLYLHIEYKGNNIMIPFRTTIKDNVNKSCYYPLPTNTRPKAGLDYRKALVINDQRMYEEVSQYRIPNAQQKRIENNYITIQRQMVSYINGYIKTFRKHRVDREEKYKYSTLQNFHVELGIDGASEQIAASQDNESCSLSYKDYQTSYEIL